MANKTKFQAIKGTRDLLPPETELWNRVEQTAREVFGTFGFGEIRLPIFEPTELFARAVGGETDIVSKEMYTFKDYDTSNELAMQYLLVFSTKDPKNHDETIELARLAGRLIRLGRSALENGQLSKSPENLRALDQIELYSDKLPGLASQGPREIGPVAAALRNAVTDLVLGDELALRPEVTASVCRAYIEHNMHALPQPVKLYCIGPMFRRERPQKGRYRQFYQIDVEVLEAITPNQDATKTIGKDAAVDAEVIEMVMVYFARLGLEGVQLDINSIGHSEPPVDSKNVCRRAYVERLKAALETVKGRLGEDSQRRIETNPLRVLDSKLESEQAIIEKLPRIGDHLCADCAKHYAEVKRQLELRGVAYRENWRLVRAGLLHADNV